MAARPLVSLVTGASSGFGALTARVLARSGHRVYAGFLQSNDDQTSVYKDAATFAKDNNCQLQGIELNVVKDDSIRSAIDEIMANEGRIDVVVHNAAPYFAAKAAQDSLAQTYALEISRFGIETSIIVPGVFTKGTNHFATAMKAADTAVEKEYMEGVLKGWDQISAEGHDKIVSPDADPAAVAEAVCRVVSTEHGKRPFRVHVEYDGGGAAIVSGVRDLVRETYLTKLGLADLMKVKVFI
ncbi:uncharacterized protein Z518_06829 [Rhinocladiella mackenziei CBS 650.93]|uniref:Uncharacterized protein n=1 Tax=Rhinocladiella mackenziei CBS 650.93 TaxID=1442369 RepID=A0A0D2FMN0_9EURO|nr:uncharacterized protein Z518_06829 [Rhinocladiella mackenziei CBS 650.93]KIX03277.1 hypothetical protein Z518_06829 [Rhinocladiella mackenziei CBS 650.93]